MPNIWSGSTGLLAKLTNPTELAKKKGNLKRSYPITLMGRKFPDAEAAYKFLKTPLPDDADYLFGLMVTILTHKLDQYPSLVRSIKKRGGLYWLRMCEHTVHLPGNRSPNRWEGKGGTSLFIAALMAAYSYALTKSATQDLKEKGFFSENRKA